MKKFCKAVIEDNIIHLEEKVNLPNGMYSIVILQPTRDDKQEEIKIRPNKKIQRTLKSAPLILKLRIIYQL